jgi:hypothetical protein
MMDSGRYSSRMIRVSVVISSEFAFMLFSAVMMLLYGSTLFERRRRFPAMQAGFAQPLHRSDSTQNACPSP